MTHGLNGLLHRTAADRRIVRGYLLGDFELYLLDGRDVIRSLRGLVLQGVVRLRPIGPPDLTDRGRWVFNGPD